MKHWYTALCTVLISLLIAFVIGIGIHNVSDYLHFIPWTAIEITFGILIALAILVDVVYVIFRYKANWKFVFDRWLLFLKSVGLFFTDFKNDMMILMIIITVFLGTTFFIGANVIYKNVYDGFVKAVKYDNAIADLRNKYQGQITVFTQECNDLKIEKDKLEEENQSLKDDNFIMEQQMSKLQVEIKRLLPKGSKKRF